MRLRYRFVLIIVLLGVLGQGSVLAQDDDEGDVVPTPDAPVISSSLPVLNIILGIDISRSHYDIESGDQEVPIIREREGVGRANLRPTDPTNMRFDSATKILTWLGQNADLLGVRMNVNLIPFSNAARAWDEGWRNVSAFDDPQLALRPPSSTTGTGNWATLAREATRVFANNANSNPNARNVLIVITDGVSCEALSTLCTENAGTIQSHLNTVIFSTTTHMLLTPFTVDKAIFRTGHTRGGTSILTRVESLVSATGGNFYDFDNIDEMPSILAQLLLVEIGKSKGTLELPAGGLDVRVADLDWAQINPSLARVTEGRFAVPYYQAQANMLFLLSRTNLNQQISIASPVFSLAGNTRPLDVPTGEFLGNVYLYQFPSPPQGIITASRPDHKIDGFIFYTPAEARLTIVPEAGNSPTQYEQFRLIYQLFNNDGAPLPIAQNALPNLSATAVVGNDTPFTLTSFTRVTLLDDSVALQSDLFFLAENRPYTFTLQATPQSAWTEDNTLDYSFLTPNPAFVTVSPIRMNFIADIGEEGGTTTLNTSRDTEIPIVVRVEVDGEPYPIPNGVTATLITESIDGQGTQACESLSRAIFNPDSANGVDILRTTVTFAESGQCRLVVNVMFDSVASPIDDSLPVPSSSQLRRLVDVDDTTRLTIGTFDPTYAMDEYQDVFANIFKPETIAWVTTGNNAPFPSASLSFEVRLTNEDASELRDFPEFSTDATFPERSHCTGTAPRPVPFQLQILDNVTSRDRAIDFGICLNSTDAPGVYLATISQLPAGNYTVNVTLNQDATALNRARFSYVASIQDNYSLPLTVSTPSIVTVVRLIIWGLLIILAGILGLLARRLFIAFYASRRNPLSGKIQIVIQSGESKYAIWEKALPKKHTVTYTDFDEPIELLRLGISSLKVTTKKEGQMSKESMAYVEIDTDPYTLLSKSEQSIKEMGNYRYFIVKDIFYPLEDN